MKKLLSILLAAMMCLSLAACGSSAPDKQPAIDAYNELAKNYNEFVDTTNADLSGWSEEDIDYMNSIADVITECGKKLESDEELTQEQIDEIISECNEFNDVIVEYMSSEG